MISLPRFRRPSLRMQYLLSAMLLGLSIQLLTLHTDTVRDMRDIGLPAALALPAIQHRMDILKEQTEMAELQTSISGNPNEEMLKMYVLPNDTALERLLATLDAVTLQLRREGNLQTLSAVEVGEATPVDVSTDDGPVTYTKTAINFEADVTEKGLESLFLFQELSGYLTVSDALTPEQQSNLLHLTEQENPAAVTALEAFLATDLLTYAKAPQRVEDQLFKSFSSDSFMQTVRGVIQQSSLTRIAPLLSGSVGSMLEAQKLWPLRFLMPVKSAIRQTAEGQYHIAVMWEAYSR